MICVLACVLVLVSGPAFAAHPLSVDDAGTVDPRAWELELSSAMVDAASGPSHGFGVAARLGLHDAFDSGVGVAWFDAGTEDSGYEFVLDLKFAPGTARGWRPRPFVRSDLSLLAVSGQTEASLAGLCGGLTWEFAQSLLTFNSCWARPFTSSISTASSWSVAGGIFLPVHQVATVALEMRRGEWGDWNSDQVRAGVLTRLGRGNLSIGVELPLAGASFDSAIALLGWTAEFAD